MFNQLRIKQSMAGALLLIVGGIALRGQEPPPPPPPPGEGGGNVFFFNRMEGASPTKLVKGAPFSAQAITETSQTLSDGNQIHRQSTASLYRDSEGRTRREQTLGGFGPWSTPGNKTEKIIRISDPVAGANFVLNPDQRTAQKMPARKGGERLLRQGGPGPGMPPPPGEGERTFNMKVHPAQGGDGGVMRFEREGGPEGGDVKTESLGSQVIEGVQADGTRTTFMIPAGRIGNDKPILVVTERWYSNQLQEVVMSKRNDPRVGETIYRLTNINQAEPAPALFQVPAEYTVQDSPGFHRQNRREAPPVPNQ